MARNSPKGVVPPKLQKFLFKKGNQVAKGKHRKSLKVFVKEYLVGLPDEEKIKFLNAVEPELAWRMGEGNPKQETEVDLQGIEKLERATEAILKNLHEPSSGKRPYKKQV